MKKKTKKQIGIENFGKKSERKQIPYWLKDVFDDPKDINWTLVKMYQKVVQNFMKDHAKKVADKIKEEYGITVYWDDEGKFYTLHSDQEKISQEEFEKIISRYIFENMFEGE